MARYGLVLFCLVALFSSAALATRELPVDGDDQGRQLLQTPGTADCDRSVKNCLTCRYQFLAGTVSRAICLTCATGYVVKASGRGCCEFLGWGMEGCRQHCTAERAQQKQPQRCTARSHQRQQPFACKHSSFLHPLSPTPTPCLLRLPLNPLGCAPGYYLSAPNTCTKCGLNYYCAGAKSTPAADRILCGTNKLTTTEFARSDRECVVEAGYGWAPGNGSAICETGAYNPGFNNRACTRCPGGLTTATTGTNSSTACMAPTLF
jgi:hypothetical protein